MKTKTINAEIAKKVNAWLETIDDPAVRALARKNTIVTGGCIASMLLQEPVNDYDLYFRNIETATAVGTYYTKKFNADHPGTNSHVIAMDDRVKIRIQSSGVAGDESTEDREDTEPFHGDILAESNTNSKKKFRPVFMTANAVTLSNDVQLIMRFVGEPDEIHENYDFVHCTNYWDSNTGKVVLRVEALEALLTRELRYVGSRYPLSSIIRTRKFIKRGWSINAGQFVKMAMQLNLLNLLDPEVLEDQLIGVDVTYFNQLVIAVKSKGNSVDTAYIITLIDKIF